MAHAPLPGETAAAVLDYLAQHLPGYPFDPEVDAAFVDELLDDFADLDLLEPLKRLRWYYDDRPVANIRSARGAIRARIRRARR